MTALVTAGEAAIVPASPMPLTPSELTGDGVSVRSSSKDGTSAALGQRVVGEVARDELAVLVVVDALEQRLADGVHDPAVDLAVDQLRVDRRAAVVDRDVADDVDVAGLRVHVDHARVRAEREHEVLRVVERELLEPRLHALGQVLRDVGRAGDLADASCPCPASP